MKEKLDELLTKAWNVLAEFLIKTGMAVDVSWVEYKEVGENK